MLKDSVRLPNHCFKFEYLEFHSNEKTFNIGRAYFCQLIHFLNWVVRNILIIKLWGFAEIFVFLTPAPVVSVFFYHV